MHLTSTEIAAATDGEHFGRESVIDQVAIDSRRAGPGHLFVPIVAERDGHDYIDAAIAVGATTYLTQGFVGAGTAIRVADTTDALAALGRLARARLPDHVVGVTGSVGKTSVKDLLRGIAARRCQVAASEASFNNELGVPLTLLNAPDDTDLLVVEMGARGVGHIAHLCQVAAPTVGVVTVVAEAHLEHFETIDEVARGKAELVASLPKTGTAVLNADDERVAAMARATEAAVLTYGVVDGEVRAEEVLVDRDNLRAEFWLRSPWGSADVRLGVAGRHMVHNALAAAAAALVSGIPLDDVVEGLAAARLSSMRMDLVRVGGGAMLLDDSYNANPTSMRAALDALSDLPVSRRVAVLGTMAELGSGAAQEHRAMARHADLLGIRVISVGEPRYGIIGPDAVDDADGALSRLRSTLGRHDGLAILVKGSRMAGLERVVEALKADS